VLEPPFNFDGIISPVSPRSKSDTHSEFTGVYPAIVFVPTAFVKSVLDVYTIFLLFSVSYTITIPAKNIQICPKLFSKPLHLIAETV
jgi:hypothetical protein